MSTLKLNFLLFTVAVLTMIVSGTMGLSIIGGIALGCIIGMLALLFGDDEVGIKTYRSLRFDEPYAVLASYPIQAVFTEYYFRKWDPIPDTLFLVQERNYGKQPFLVAAGWGNQPMPNFVKRVRNYKGLLRHD